MTQEALKLALEALTYIYTETTADEDELIDQAITAIKEALAQPEQEPVAWVCMNYKKHDIDFDQPAIDAIPVGTMLYTHPQRTWVGLTEQERNDIEDYCEMMIGKPAFDAIEAKLKEKNSD